MEYIRRQMAAHPGDECRVFFADRGECTAAKMDEWRADIVHVNHLKALVQLFRNPFARPQGKVVFTVHGIHLRKYDFLPKTLANRAKRLLRLSLERRLYRKCDKLIALTPTDSADIQRLYGPGLPVVVEPNSVDASEFAEASADLRFKRDEFAFVCIARFDFQKGQDVLVEAIAQAQEKLRGSGSRTLFIGDGPALAGVKREADRLGIADIAVFAGEIPNAGAYMTCGRFLVSPSRWEGMPYLLLEAVARKRRVIASDCPGNRDVLKGYSAANLFPVEDAAALATLLKEAR
jgi:glycosyltransferase involved in cell wall biosynthesis